MGRPATCLCGDCTKCKRREQHRQWYQRLTPDERRAVVAKRDPEKVRAADRARYYRHHEMRKKLMKEWAERNWGRTLEHKRRWAAQNQDKRKAQNAVNNAIRDGRFERNVCEVCGGKAQAHHHDYSKPFDVRWLCPAHHGEVHRKYA